MVGDKDSFFFVDVENEVVNFEDYSFFKEIRLRFIFTIVSFN